MAKREKQKQAKNSAPDVIVEAVAEEASKYNFHPTQKGKWNDDGTYSVNFKASGSKEIIWHVFKWGAGCQILSPESLKDDYKKYLDDVMKNF